LSRTAGGSLRNGPGEPEHAALRGCPAVGENVALRPFDLDLGRKLLAVALIVLVAAVLPAVRKGREEVFKEE
jgi:hypothetical protein